MDVATTNGHAPSFAIFPVEPIVDDHCGCGKADCSSPGKHPIASLVPHGLNDASRDQEILKKWLAKRPNANFGIPTGDVNDLVVIDIDADSGGLESLRELEGEYGETLPKTWTVNTPRGGGSCHYYFRKPAGRVMTSRNGWRPGIDIKANGGYVVGVESNHVKGIYRWAKGRSSADVPMAEIPAWLLDLLPQKGEEKPPARVNGSAHNPDNLQRAQSYVAKASAAGEGNRNDSAFRLAGNAAAFGLSESEVYALLLPWNLRNAPELTETELRQCVKSAFCNGTPRAPKEERRGMPDLRPAEYRDNPPQQERKEITYQRISSAELDSNNYNIEYAIEGAMVLGQPLEIGGPMKALKTSILVDGAISLAAGGFFLGRFKVSRKHCVMVTSGESGMGSLQEIARRVCGAAGHQLREFDNLIWSPDIPKLNSFDHLDALEKFLVTDGVEVWFCDPAYLAMPSADAGNLMAQGELLRNASELCQRIGVSMVLCHHTKRNTGQDPYEPLELQHLAWAGHAEFARQWWLVNRRERYEPGTGEHRLWLSIGGSAGHSSLWALDVSEGTLADIGGRRWELNLTDPAGARDAEDERRKEGKKERATKQVEADTKTICEALAALPDDTGTKTDIKDATALNESRFRPAFGKLITDKRLTKTTITKTNGQTYEAYKLATDEN